ncbi:MAG: zinc ribbon domain-containing protein [Myxococcota bacterium]
MPIYEYACDNCGKIMEVLQKMSDPGPAKCEHCGSKKVKRVMSQTSFQLKGDGWYITDYARKGQKDGGAKEGGSESKSESKKESKSDSKKDSKKKDGKKAS